MGFFKGSQYPLKKNIIWHRLIDNFGKFPFRKSEHLAFAIDDNNKFNCKHRFIINNHNTDGLWFIDRKNPSAGIITIKINDKFVTYSNYHWQSEPTVEHLEIWSWDFQNLLSVWGPAEMMCDLLQLWNLLAVMWTLIPWHR